MELRRSGGVEQGELTYSEGVCVQARNPNHATRISKPATHATRNHATRNHATRATRNLTTLFSFVDFWAQDHSHGQPRDGSGLCALVPSIIL